jgi:hypothetical protein
MTASSGRTYRRTRLYPPIQLVNTHRILRPIHVLCSVLHASLLPQTLTLLTHVREMYCSNLDRDTDFREFFVVFLSPSSQCQDSVLN